MENQYQRSPRIQEIIARLGGCPLRKASQKANGVQKIVLPAKSLRMELTKPRIRGFRIVRNLAIVLLEPNSMKEAV